MHTYACTHARTRMHTHKGIHDVEEAGLDRKEEAEARPQTLVSNAGGTECKHPRVAGGQPGLEEGLAELGHEDLAQHAAQGVAAVVVTVRVGRLG
jgi:hypothetical protein